MQLVTWNTQWCCGLDGQVDPVRIIAGVDALGGCDVLCLQEIAIHYPALQGQPGDQLEAIRALLPGWQVFFGPGVQEFDSNGMHSFGNLIATRLPVLQVQHYPLPYPCDPGVSHMPRSCTAVIVQDPQLGAVRVMTTHLEYYSPRQRMAQARFLRRLQFEQLSQHYQPGVPGMEGGPSQARVQPAHTVLCGDFNFGPQAPEYEVMQSPANVLECLDAGWPEEVVGHQWHDAWQSWKPATPQPPTFCLYDKRFGNEAVACDFVWLSTSLRHAVQDMQIDGQTQVSDHQPVRIVLGQDHTA